MIRDFLKKIIKTTDEQRDNYNLGPYGRLIIIPDCATGKYRVYGNTEDNLIGIVKSVIFDGKNSTGAPVNIAMDEWLFSSPHKDRPDFKILVRPDWGIIYVEYDKEFDTISFIIESSV